jgi:hypothetical protein
MKNFIKKYRIVILILIIIILIFAYFATNKKEEGNNTVNVPPSITPPVFELINTFPKQGVQEMGNPQIALQYTFSTPIDINSSKVEITPYIPFNVNSQVNINTLTVSPLDNWKYDQEYKVIVDVTARDGRKFENFTHTFTFTRPTDSPLVE